MSKPNENDEQVVSRVPKLRFEGFEGGWEEIKLEDLSQNRLSNGVFNDPKRKGIHYKLINVSDMYISGSILDNNLSFVDISEKEFLKNNVEYGDIFFTRSSLVKSGIAYSNIYLGRSKNITFDCHLIKLKPNKEKVYPIFLNYILRTNYIRSQLVSRGKTATMTTIGQNDVAQVKLNLPSLPEQQKIASCLSSLDELISAESQKLESLKEHKKGLMQKLFPQQGQTVPQLRFEGFDGEWEEKQLGEEGDFLSSLNGKSGADFDVGEAKFITYMNVYSNTFVDPKMLRLVDVKQGENQNKVSVGDVFFTISSETPEEVGMSSVLLEEIDNCYLNSFCTMFRFFKSKKPNLVFFGYLMRQPHVRHYFAQKAQGSTRYNLSKSAFKNLPVIVPTTPEQQKIASCLSSLDDLITSQADYINTLKQHKKGLMQQLFPSMDETN